MKAGNKITVHADEYEECDVVSNTGTTDKNGQLFYYNTYVRSSADEVGGVCAKQYKAGFGLFNHQKQAIIRHTKSHVCVNEGKFRRECAQKGAEGQQLKKLCIWFM